MRQGITDWRFICVWIVIYWIRPTSTTVTVTASDGTGIVKQQPLTLGCNYTKGVSDVIDDFEWRHEGVAILSGSVTGETARFQPGTGWESGVFLGDYTSSLTIQLRASNVALSVAGQYTCTVELIAGPIQDTATATVYYSPKIKSNFPSSRTVTEFSRLQIDCRSYTTPGNPSASYTWTNGGSTISSNAVLDIHNIGRDRRGQYTCTASNTVGSDSETVSVDVQYAPKVESNFLSSRTVIEFSRLHLDCSSYTTPGNPPTTSFNWTYGGSTISPEAVLDLINIDRDRKGQYTCTASNTVGSDSETVNVDVQYLDRPELLVNNTEVVENETVSLTCNVESNPTAEVVIRNVDNNTVLVERDTNRLQFTIDRVQCVHNGSFHCTARNTQIGDMSSSVLRELNVLCSPRQDYRRAFIQYVNCGLGDVASLAMYIIANPSPKFDWYVKKNEQLLPIPTSTEHSIVSSKQASVLQIQVENSKDYGTYSVIVENSIGRLQKTFTVSPISPGSSHQTPDRLGLGVGIGISVMIPVIIVILSLWWLSQRRELKNPKRANIDRNELPLQQNSATGDQKAYADLTLTESTVNEYEQVQVPPGQSKVYQNV